MLLIVLNDGSDCCAVQVRVILSKIDDLDINANEEIN